LQNYILILFDIESGNEDTNQKAIKNQRAQHRIKKKQAVIYNISLNKHLKNQCDS